jgi:glycosyltransferase involved in cell wall biosynthesis
VRRSLEFSVSHAAAVITNSIELAEFVRQFSSNVSVLPSFFDFSLTPETAVENAPVSDEIRIGFAGSPSRAPDLDVVALVIPDILQRYPNVAFEFIGASPRGLKASNRLRQYPHINDYQACVRFQLGRRWSIGLAPLVDNEANRGKTDNKYREYGAFRCAGVYTAIPPYTHVVTDRVTGLLVDNSASSWITAVNELIENPVVRRSIAEAAQQNVRKRYDVTQVAQPWANLFQTLSDRVPDCLNPSDAIRVEHRRMMAFFSRCRLQIDIMRQQGGWPLVGYRASRKLIRTTANCLSEEKRDETNAVTGRHYFL